MPAFVAGIHAWAPKQDVGGGTAPIHRAGKTSQCKGELTRPRKKPAASSVKAAG